MFEYMSSSIPVIASDFPYWKEIIENHKCGVLVDPLDPKSISEGIKTLIEDPDLALNLGANGRKTIEKFLNWESENLKLINFTKEFLNK